MLMILAPPAGDAFNFVVNLSIYPSQAFQLALAIGLYLVRWERRKAGLAPPGFRAWHVAIIFSILVNIYCLVMPWYPPPGGKDAGLFSFWYAAYVVTGIGM
jgi:Amino acid permease